MTEMTMDLQEQIARIERMQEETRKFVAEGHKLAAEQQKLLADSMKTQRDHALAPWQITIGAMTAGAALFGAGVALMKVLGG
ncbi:hypothetical protein V5F34_08525 [Xanthobacter autotrophicus]|uniref:hypothetical protein n=1 Tax=Xanthobacter autotrophicus TaxID=280 RepID=UPI00372B6C96